MTLPPPTLPSKYSQAPLGSGLARTTWVQQEACRTAPLHPHCMSCSWLELPIDFLRSLLQTFTADTVLWCFIVLPLPSNSWDYLSLSGHFTAPAPPYFVILPEFQIVLHSVTCRKHGVLCSNQYMLLSCFSYLHSHISTDTSICITIIILLLSDKDNAPWKLLTFCIPWWGKKISPTYYTASGCLIAEIERLLRQVADSRPSD